MGVKPGDRVEWRTRSGTRSTGVVQHLLDRGRVRVLVDGWQEHRVNVPGDRLVVVDG